MIPDESVAAAQRGNSCSESFAVVTPVCASGAWQLAGSAQEPIHRSHSIRNPSVSFHTSPSSTYGEPLDGAARQRSARRHLRCPRDARAPPQGSHWAVVRCKGGEKAAPGRC